MVERSEYIQMKLFQLTENFFLFLVKIQIKTYYLVYLVSHTSTSFTIAIIMRDPKSLFIISVTSSQVDSTLQK